MKKYFVILLFLASNSAFGMEIMRKIRKTGKQFIRSTLGSIPQFSPMVRAWPTRKKKGTQKTKENLQKIYYDKYGPVYHDDPSYAPKAKKLLEATEKGTKNK